ncbi:transcriptional regulator [Mycobacterium paraense]|uniref:Transcriptional regulator n=1 Tax=Mycobacterium paraense TaxID=767916 RepID=A0ABX3VRH1_9MYCO|nr:LuxR family transcriptional regulator [Mycobacterium paraense]ORW32016.1 transcriptional regulator [Mycobacterium paraense]ORW39544.1 transcriptional regulator [Mycobacterium paraense]
MRERMPTGTVTLLLADSEGSERLWESQPEQTTAALARLGRAASEIVPAHDGVLAAGTGGGDGFLAAFAHATDAVACAVALQRAPLAPIRLRVGVHTGEVELGDAGEYVGSTPERAAALRDLAHGGQILLSGITRDLVIDQLPADAWLTDLGTHQLGDLPRPERLAQLCHSDLDVEFPPLRTTGSVVPHGLPVQLTRFVGRVTLTNDVVKALYENRLVTLAGAGGVGKTRLAVQVAAQAAAEFDGNVWFVDLTPVTDPEVVPVAAMRALGLPDQPGRSATETLVRFLGDRPVLLVLDNCEHLIDECAELTVALLGACPQLTILTTSREPIGVAGEVTWRVPSLSLADEAIELFVDRARLARPDFSIAVDDSAAVREICVRVDGLPLGIELAAARVRMMSLTEILDGLRNRFRLVTGARVGTRRKKTLGESVDWSHALLTEPERILFRRLAVFRAGFDLDAARAVGDGDPVQQQQVLDRLAQLVDKSLVVAEYAGDRTRFRLLETVRHYAAAKLAESGEADEVHARHRDYYTALAALLDSAADADHQRRIEQVEIEIDNLRAAFAWSRQTGDIEKALELTSSLQPLWQTRGRIQEGLAWFDATLAEHDARRSDISAVVRGRALADKAVLDASRSIGDNLEQAQQAVAIAREIDDPALLARALTACGAIASYSAAAARPYLAEAIGIARSLDDQWRLTQILTWQANGAFYAGDPIAAEETSQEGWEIADAIGDRFHARSCRWTLGLAQMMKGDLAQSVEQFEAVTADADAAHDVLFRWGARLSLSLALSFQGDTSAAMATARASLDAAGDLWPYNEGFSYAVLVTAAAAAGDLAAATEAIEAAQQRLSPQGELGAAIVNPMADVALARGDLVEARRWADQQVAASAGWHLARALTTRARISIAKGEPDQAERDAHKALGCAAECQAHLAVPDILECLGRLAADGLSHRDSARLFGAADRIRHRIGVVRFRIHDADHERTLAALRDTMGEQDFDAAWAEGAGLSLDEAVAYARRGRGERKRPTSGWAALTPTERDVAWLVADGLANNEIAARLFISRRTVQTHLTHVYAKLGISSRVQLAQEVAGHR